MATGSPAHRLGGESRGAGDPDARGRNAGYRVGVKDERKRAGGYREQAATDYRDHAARGYRGTQHRRDTTGGAEGNERLTALTGMALLVLFAAEGVTILSVRRMLTLHFVLGMLLIGPVALKACSTMYRFVRYYSGAAGYRRKGPPAPLLRMLGPVVVLTSVAVIGTGVMLVLTGPGGRAWLFLHKASFVLWFGAMTVHVLAYVWRLPRLARGELASRAGRRANQVLAGRTARWLLLTASILTGLLLAMLTLHRAGAWPGSFGRGH
ncbi:MAG TPA: hypothetical protein VGI05_20675 [Streptosporangiaceae bacterium]